MNTERSGVFGVPMQVKYRLIDELSASFDDAALKYRAMKTMGAEINTDIDFKMQETFVAVSRCRSELIRPTDLRDAAIAAVSLMVDALEEILDLEMSSFVKNNGIVPQNIEDIHCVCGNCPDFDKSNIN
jgi:hypothetical protein